MRPIVRCIIDDGSDRSCGQYIENLPAPQTQDDCTVDLRFFYDFTHVGTICDDVYLFETGIDGQDLVAFTPDFTDDERYFCPGEELSIEELVAGYDICSLAGREVPVDVKLNGLPANGSSVFPSLAVAVCGDHGERIPTKPIAVTFLVSESCTCGNPDSPTRERNFRKNRDLKRSNSNGMKSKGGKGKGTVTTMVCRTWMEFRTFNTSLVYAGFHEAGDEIAISGTPTLDNMMVDIYHLINGESPGVPVESFTIDPTCVQVGDTFGCLELIFFTNLE